MFASTILVPAYGRIYLTTDAALADWNAGKDFRVYPTSSYTSIRDISMLKSQLTAVYIMLSNLNKTVTL